MANGTIIRTIYTKPRPRYYRARCTTCNSLTRENQLLTFEDDKGKIHRDCPTCYKVKLALDGGQASE